MKMTFSSDHFIKILFLGSMIKELTREMENYTRLPDIETVKAYDNYGVINNLFKASQLKNYLERLKKYDKYTYQHCKSVGLLAFEIGIYLNLPCSKQYDLIVSGLLHDIGKLEVPLEILCKPQRLTDEEFKIIKKHPQFGKNFVSSILSSNKDIIKAIYEHHEQLNGKGYVMGLGKKDIPEYAQIISLADIWDAISTNRTYRKAFPKKKCIKIIKEEQGKHFARKYVDALFSLIKYK